MERLDALAATHRTVALAVRHDDPELGRLLEQADRILALVVPEEAAALAPALDATSRGADLVLFSATAATATPVDEGRVVRRCAAEPHGAGRGLARASSGRTKLGLAWGPAAPSASPTPACSKRSRALATRSTTWPGAAWGRWSPLGTPLG